MSGQGHLLKNQAVHAARTPTSSNWLDHSGDLQVLGQGQNGAFIVNQIAKLFAALGWHLLNRHRTARSGMIKAEMTQQRKSDEMMVCTSRVWLALPFDRGAAATMS